MDNSPFCTTQPQHAPVSLKQVLTASHINYEEYRIRTFKSWPTQAPIQADRLARAGFYYMGNGLEVICFSCGGRVSNWTYGDVAMQKHVKLFPKCDFVNNKSTNVPLLRHFAAMRLDTSAPGSSKGPNVPNGFDVPRQSQCPAKTPATPRQSEEHFQRMKSEKERLKTFVGKWPRDYIDPSEIARAGLFYLQILDKVQCAFCHGVLTSWEPGDKPYVEHARNFPACPFVLGRNVGNIPLGQDICGAGYPRPIERKRMLNSYPENGFPPSVDDAMNTGVTLHTGPKHPSQASKDARLRSFLPWPQNAPVKKEDLAEAGFFYIGLKDNVKCYCCDGGLNNWEAGDEPWVEHARWYPNCYYVVLNKGNNFIKECFAKENGSSQVKKSQPSVTFFSTEGEPSPLNGLPTAAVNGLPTAAVNGLPTAAVNGLPTAAVNGFSHAGPSVVQHSESDEEMVIENSPSAPAVENFWDKEVEDTMQSSLLRSFLQANAFPPHVVRLAVLRKFQKTGCGVHNVDELCEAIHRVRNEQQLMAQTEPEEQNTQCLEEETVCVQPTKLETPGKVPDLLESRTGELTLEEENRQLKEQRLCKICMDQDVGVVFLPCGHLIACAQCAPALTECAFCRSPIKGVIRTFLS